MQVLHSPTLISLHHLVRRDSDRRSTYVNPIILAGHKSLSGLMLLLKLDYILLVSLVGESWGVDCTWRRRESAYSSTSQGRRGCRIGLPPRVVQRLTCGRGSCGRPYAARQAHALRLHCCCCSL